MKRSRPITTTSSNTGFTDQKNGVAHILWTVRWHNDSETARETKPEPFQIQRTVSQQRSSHEVDWASKLERSEYSEETLQLVTAVEFGRRLIANPCTRTLPQAIKQECDAIMNAIEKWHTYFDGSPFRIERDRQPWLSFDTGQEPN
jgi:hypothetical protein